MIGADSPLEKTDGGSGSVLTENAQALLPQPVVVRPEMHLLVSAQDWSASAIGPFESWPQSLRTTVDLILGSPLAMIVLWGPDLVQIYNDAYAVIAGARHPRALGQPTHECWPENARTSPAITAA